ncbi:MAG: radical SAM protein [Candidatus Aminicenantes bacterium]|nr:MAG: radical SAM protein [Candidatus Aminicenantes bacterium]
MKILLISPSVDPNEKTNKQMLMPQLALFILQGLTPKEHQVVMLDEEAEDIDLEQDCDLVGISFMTSNASRAYWLAREFKERGKTVVLGGVHPTLLPDEAAPHGDSVVVGEAEGVWSELLEDCQQGRLKKIYHNPRPDLSRYVPKDFSKITRRHLFGMVPIMTTRGCPYHCDFCCVTDLFGKEIRHIPIENVVRDIKESGKRLFMFLDDNIIGHPSYAKELFAALKPLKISWVGQSSIALLVKDDELLKLAVESGCKGLFVGLESIKETQMSSLRKSFLSLRGLEDGLKKVRRAGLFILASMIFGFDEDTKDVFDETVKFLRKNKVHSVAFNVLTPYPGTKTFQKMKEQGRLLTDDWKYYDHSTVVFKPKNMSAYELMVGKIRARKAFYSPWSILWRLPASLRHPLVYLAMNWGHFKGVRVEEKRLALIKKDLYDMAK